MLAFMAGASNRFRMENLWGFKTKKYLQALWLESPASLPPISQLRGGPPRVDQGPLYVPCEAE